MTTAVAGATAFWSSAGVGAVGQMGATYYVVMPITARMEIIFREGDESFQDAVTRQNGRMPFTCAINGPQYGMSASGYASIALGNVDAKEVLPEGFVVRQGTPIAGRTSPLSFYVAFDHFGGYTFGSGNPPANSSRAVGGVGPIIIDGMPYGVGTVCKQPANCKPIGPPPPGMEGYMVQRSNLTYAAQQNLPAGTGKTVLATNKELGRLMVCVQPNGGGGMSFDALKFWLLGLGCDNAVFFDGSDSATLHARGVFWVRPGLLKNRTNAIGVAFYS